jgi:hypothetical protein
MPVVRSDSLWIRRRYRCSTRRSSMGNVLGSTLWSECRQ